MNRVLQYLNFLGVVTLAVLCAVQWRANLRLNQEADRLELTRQEQAAKIAEQEKTIKGYVADLDDFRVRLERSETALTETLAKLTAATTERDQLAAQRDQLLTQRDQLKATLDKWVAAVKQRDQTLKQAGEQIQKLAKERNEAIVKFNELVGKYNALVKG